MDRNVRRGIARNIGYLTQLGFSICFPMIACTMGAVWLCDSRGWGTWIIPVGVVFGIVSGLSCFTTFYRHAMRQSRRKEDEKH